MTSSFDIKVALLGYVGVGKTTVLHALLQDKFSEVQQTSAGVNLVRMVASAPISGKRKATDSGILPKGKERKASVGGKVESDSVARSPALPDEPMSSAPATLLEEDAILAETTFHVEVREPLCEMRKDTTLVFVDIPGLNEPANKEKSLNYVSENWDTFDCVVVVLDVHHGVQTEDEVQLLTLVKRKLKTKKNVPVLVLCNKVDDPEDEELVDLVAQVQTKVEQLFEVDNRAESLDQLLTAYRQGTRGTVVSAYPMFIPMSAGYAFACRTAKSCSLDAFQQVEIKLVDKIGHDEMSKTRWKKLSVDQKYKTVYDLLRDPKQHQERITATNFDKFLAALSYSIGGDAVQRSLLGMQIKVSLGKLLNRPIFLQQFGSNLLWCQAVVGHPIAIGAVPSGSFIANKLQAIYDKYKSVGCNPVPIKAAFWKMFEKIRSALIYPLQFSADPRFFADVMNELVAYRDFTHSVGWNDENGKIKEQAGALVGKQINLVLERESRWSIKGAILSRYDSRVKIVHRAGTLSRAQRDGFPWDWKEEEGEENNWTNIYTNEKRRAVRNPAFVSLIWNTLTYHDWCTIVGSLLQVADNKHVAERFGQEKILLAALHHRHNVYAKCLTRAKSTEEEYALANIPIFSEGSTVNGKFVPKDPVKYRVVAQIVAPELISDPSHWGHVMWRFCNLMDHMETVV